jgi:hypothetical protein
MKRKILWILKIHAVPLVAFICGIAVARMNLPKMSNDLWAYVYLCSEAKTDDIKTAKAYAEAARSCASDPQLQSLADKTALERDMFLNAGVIRKVDIGSFSGLSKAVKYGASSPLDAVLKTIQTWNLEERAKQIDSIYAPQLQDYNTKKARALSLGNFVFYGGCIIGWIWLFVIWKRAKV